MLLEKECFHFLNNDGYLSALELKKILLTNKKDFLRLFKRMTDNKILELKEKNHIYHRRTVNECKHRIVMDDMIYNDSIKLYGFKKFLLTFDGTNDKDLIDVKLWDEYLMFGYLLGATGKITKTIGKFYTNIAEEMPVNGLDIDICCYLDTLSNNIIPSSTHDENFSNGTIKNENIR